MQLLSIESGFNPYAAAGTTTACGLGQFIDKPWSGYNLTPAERWSIPIQANALVAHFLDNKNRMLSKNLSEPYIYKFHHDGPIDNYGGLDISIKKIIPKIGEISNVIHKIF